MKRSKQDAVPGTAIKSRRMMLPYAIVLIIALGYVDLRTGYEVSFAVFYLWPILLVAWNQEKVSAVALSLMSAVIWMMVDLAAGHVYSQAWIPCWNALTRLGFFLITVFLTIRFKKEFQAAHELARTDSTTGLLNSRAFMSLFKIEAERSRRFRRPVTLMYMDLDNFKRLNDEFGHDRGDEVLSLFATTLKTNTRIYDVAARLGGDEFVVLLPETSLDQARQAVQKLKDVLTKTLEEQAPFVTISIGVVTHRNPEGIQNIIRIADALMYEVKESGKGDVRFKEII